MARVPPLTLRETPPTNPSRSKPCLELRHLVFETWESTASYLRIADRSLSQARGALVTLDQQEPRPRLLSSRSDPRFGHPSPTLPRSAVRSSEPSGARDLLRHASSAKLGAVLAALVGHDSDHLIHPDRSQYSDRNVAQCRVGRRKGGGPGGGVGKHREVETELVFTRWRKGRLCLRSEQVQRLPQTRLGRSGVLRAASLAGRTRRRWTETPEPPLRRFGRCQLKRSAIVDRCGEVDCAHTAAETMELEVSIAALEDVGGAVDDARTVMSPVAI